ncbi:MAG: family transcriptional regulator, cyclic receptor protein [Solirubrobacteraceae bacterium]|nr:family transcriptional regulator, cyclic receptor protein [Solirubrobacteraceae bacterium]
MYKDADSLNRTDIVPLLDADPELGERLSADDFDSARRALLARALTIETGIWHPERIWSQDDHPTLGLLVLDGVLIRQITVADRPGSELMGSGDLLRPWDQDAVVGIPITVQWKVMGRVRLALLDQRFLLTACRWPTVVDALAGRALRRARWLSFQNAMKQIMRVEDRVLLLLWALSDRWGVVTPRGVHVRLKLTHEALGKLVGARRPSVTTAIGALTEVGAIERTEDGYRLYGDPEQALRRVIAGEVDDSTEAVA